MTMVNATRVKTSNAIVPAARRGRGRPPGSRNKRNIEADKKIAEGAMTIEDAIPDAFKGDAHALLMAIYKNPMMPIQLRIEAAARALPFRSPGSRP